MVGINCGGTLPPVQAREMIEKFYEIDPDTVVKEEIAKGNLVIETADVSEKEVSIDELKTRDTDEEPTAEGAKPTYQKWQT